MVHLLNLLAVVHANDETLPVSPSSQLAAHFPRELNPIRRNADLRLPPQPERSLDRHMHRRGAGEARTQDSRDAATAS